MSEGKLGTKGTARKRRVYNKDVARKNSFQRDIDTAAKIKCILPSSLKAQIKNLNTKHIKVLTTKHGKGKSISI